jgi:hypothetical protein
VVLPDAATLGLNAVPVLSADRSRTTTLALDFAGH